jgi:AraC family transcriptional regulator
MGERLLMRAGRGVRPLRFTAAGPLLRSATTPWAGIPFEEHEVASAHVAHDAGPPLGEHGLWVITEGHVELRVRLAGHTAVHHGTPGSVYFVGGALRVDSLQIRGRARSLALQLTPPWLGRVLLGALPVSLRSGAQPGDATVLALATAMRDEVARGAPSGRLFGEALSLALLSYVTRSAPPDGAGVRGTLPAPQAERLRRYLHDHLGEPHSIAALAGLVERSPRQFASLFKASFGTTPHRYLLEARLAEGARRLRQGAEVAALALELGFCSQSHFASAFKRAYGQTPRAYALDTMP